MYATQAEAIQNSIFHKLIEHSSATEWGRKYTYTQIKKYADFQHVPIQTYEDAKGYIDRMRHGEKDVLCPGKVIWYAKSSGTTNDKSKFIPVSPEGLKNIHYRGGIDAVALYLRENPESRFFSGKGLILGGSHSPNYNVKDSLVGDLSAILIQNINPLVNLIRVPSKEIALLSEFEEKVERIAETTIHKNVTNLSGVPSWMLAVIKRILEKTGAKHLNEVWPNLEVFFHGGVCFTPYREQYKQLIPSDKMHYMETYNASEGFFGLQSDLHDPAMTLMIDYDVFYEFIPMDELDSPKPNVVPLWGIEVGKNYAMLISTSCGLWRYMLGDTVRFTQKDPYKFIISGRTKHFINAFGEELMVDNAEKAGTCLPGNRSASAGIFGRSGIHGRKCQMPSPMAHRVQCDAGFHRKIPSHTGYSLTGNQFRLRSQTAQGHHPPGAGNHRSPSGTFPRLAETERKTGRPA